SGVTFARGSIIKVDSENTTIMTKQILVRHGFITEQDLEEYKAKGKSGDLIRSLVEEGYMSPHASDLIRAEQIVNELNKLIIDKQMKINFVPDRKLQPDTGALDMMSFLPQ